MDPSLPKPPGDEENLQRLREQAAERLKREGSPPEPPTQQPREPSTVYGGPPAPVTRRWTLRGILLLILGAIAALVAAFWGYRKITAPVYGGPPVPVYGGPPVQAPTPPPPAPPK